MIRFIFETTSLVGLAAYLGKVLIRQLLSKDLEKFKADLNIQAFEHQTRFSKLHDKQVFVIAELYEKLVNTFLAIHNYIKPFVPVGDLTEDERERQAIIAINEFTNYYRKHAIYFTAEICQKIESFITKNKDIIVDFQFKDWSEKKSEIWREVYKRFVQDVQGLKKDLEIAFRETLGMKSPQG